MTLPTQQFERKLERMGFDSGYHGQSALNAPRHEPAKTHWLRGWTRGHSERRLDLTNGTHPDLDGGNEFSEQRGDRRGTRRGVSIGGRAQC